MNRPSELHGSPASENRRNPGIVPANGKSGNFLSFFGLRRNPFNVNPDPRDLFWTPQTLRALSQLTSGVESGKSLIVLTGEVGTGKTTLINHLLNSLRERNLPVAFVFNSHLDIDNLYDFILADFGIKEDLSHPRNVRKTLHDWLFARRRSGQHPILIIDEAQGLTFQVLEEVRMLLNLEVEGEKLIQIVLSGQPELDFTLAKPQLVQLRQRISLRCKTGPLTIAETHDYVHQRLQFGGAQPDRAFAQDALDAMYFYSGGTPRIINLLCEQALMRAHRDAVSPVSSKIVEEVAREFQFGDFKPFPRSLDFGPAPLGDVLPMPSSPTKMRMAAMAARDLANAENGAVCAPALEPASAPQSAPRLAPQAVPVVAAPPKAIPSAAAQRQAQPPARAPMPPSPRMVRENRDSMRPEPAPIAARLPISARLGVVVRPAWQAVHRLIATSSRWLREPMGPAHARRG